MIESRCGLCMDMCPKEEIHRREGQNRVHPFECKIADVRTPISNETEKHGRLNAASKSYKNYRLCEEDTKCFDPHLNYANLHECLARLVTLRSSMNNDSFERMEVEALYLVHNLGSTEFLNRAFGLPKKITCHEMVKLALEINLAFVKSNYVRVMRIARKLPFILLCALLRHIEEIKKRALMIMSSAYSCRNVKYPVSCLSAILASDELECIELCKYYGIQVSGDSQSVLFNKVSCAKAKLPPPPCKYKFMQRKHDGIDLRSFFRGRYEMIPERFLINGKLVVVFPTDSRYAVTGSNDEAIVIWKFQNATQSEHCRQDSYNVHYGKVEEDENVPNEYLCPITHEVMKDPVIASDGYTYEKHAISDWLQGGKLTSPMTNKILSNTKLLPNHTLKMLIKKNTGK